MEKILISACLVGDNTKYNGGNNLTPHLDELLEKYELIPFCAEVDAGLGSPRDPIEILNNRVKTKKGRDVTALLEKACERAYNICLYLGINKVILKERSPSCGVHEIYDGTFSNRIKRGEGVLTTYLKNKGIAVYSENEIEELLKKDD